MNTGYLPPGGWHVGVTTSADCSRAAVTITSPCAPAGSAPRRLWSIRVTCQVSDVGGAYIIAACRAWRLAAEHRPVRAGGPRP